MKTMTNAFTFHEVCKPSTGRRGCYASVADVLSTCSNEEGKGGKVIWRMSFSDSIIKKAFFKPGETKLAFSYNEGVVELTPDSQGRLLSPAGGKATRTRIRYNLPRACKGFLDRGAVPEAEAIPGKITITML
jgi:hypothetical protein